MLISKYAPLLNSKIAVCGLPSGNEPENPQLNRVGSFLTPLENNFCKIFLVGFFEYRQNEGVHLIRLGYAPLGGLGHTQPLQDTWIENSVNINFLFPGRFHQGQLIRTLKIEHDG